LDPRFKQVLGRTVHQEMQRVRLERVCELLAETDLPIKRIAQAAGYRYQEYLMRAFRRTTGQTLDQYRKAARAARRR
jgi:LacI family transcriptional regulator